MGKAHKSRPRKDYSHTPVKFKNIIKPVCRKCGLIYLNNERTTKAIRKPCPGTPDDN